MAKFDVGLLDPSMFGSRPSSFFGLRFTANFRRKSLVSCAVTLLDE